MRKYLLDTNMLAAYLQSRPRAVELVLPWIEKAEAATSIIACAEVVEYIRGHGHFTQRYTQLRSLLCSIYPFFLTYAILDRYAILRRQLRPPYGSGLIGDMDTLIAATALERSLTIITTDHDFEGTPRGEPSGEDLKKTVWIASLEREQLKNTLALVPLAPRKVRKSIG